METFTFVQQINIWQLLSQTDDKHQHVDLSKVRRYMVIDQIVFLWVGSP